MAVNEGSGDTSELVAEHILPGVDEERRHDADYPEHHRFGYSSKRGRRPYVGEDNGVLWSPEVQEAFLQAARSIPNDGKGQIMRDGRQYGRNALIAEEIYRLTGQHRTRQQISDHILLLKKVHADDLTMMKILKGELEEPKPFASSSSAPALKLSNSSTPLGLSKSLSRRDVGVHERQVSSSGAFLPGTGSGPALQQSLHAMTNIPSGSSSMWDSGGSGAPFVQSLSSYSQPSPTHHYGIHPIPRRKLVEVTFDEVNYTPVDLTRHTDAGSARKDIISRVPPTTGSLSRFDIFRTHPSREEAALNDTELMLDIENFGDDRGSLKLLVRAADRYSDSHLPSYVPATATPSSPNHSYRIEFPSANLSIPSPPTRISIQTKREELEALEWNNLCEGSAATLWLSQDKDPHQGRVIKKVMRIAPQYFENASTGQDHKNLLNNLNQEFRNKFTSWSSLQDHRVASLYSIDAQTFTFYQDYYTGDLRQYCQQDFSSTKCLDIIRDVVGGIQYLHTRTPQIVHGCINPGKIYIAYDGKAKIGEFSLSQLVRDSSHLTPSISVDWMLRWMSPEFFSDNQFTVQLDVWSLGCTLFEVLTGHLPYHQHKSHVRILKLLLNGMDPNLNKDMPSPRAEVDQSAVELIWRLIKKCWAPAGQRPTVGSLSAEIFESKYNHNQASRSVPPKTPPRPGHSYPTGREMSTAEILERLNDHYCEDVTAQLGEYQVSEYPISNGGFGDVYRATHTSGRQIGLKCVRLYIDSTGDGWKKLKSVARELHTWSGCQHPNVLELIGVAEHRARLAMVSPWMANGDLSRFLSRKPVPQVNRCLLCVQIADGVSYLHQIGIVHGDLKGANILLSDDFTPKIIDFGCACIKDCTLLFSTSVNRPGFSVRWAAPEIIQDKFKDIPTGADIYSLAMTILEVISGNLPYDCVKTDAAIMFKVVNKEHPIRPEDQIPSTSQQGDVLWDLLTRCWGYDHLDRPDALTVRDEMATITPEGLL